MAVVKAVSSRASIGRATDYIQNPEKTKDSLMVGIGCSPDTVKEEMRAIKELYDKTGGRSYKHFTLNYAKEDPITYEQVLENAVKLVEETPALKGYQILIAVHTDKDHKHAHILVNSVNAETGAKLQWSKADLRDLKERCNTLSREQGLSVPEKGKTAQGAEREESTTWTKEAYAISQKAEKGEVESYKANIAMAIMDCRETATSREEFCQMMEERGYHAEWSDTRKYVTYTDISRQQAGEKKCKIRDNKLEGEFNIPFGKEVLLRELEENARRKEKRAAAIEQLRGFDRSAGGCDPAVTGAVAETGRGEPDEGIAALVGAARAEIGAARAAADDSGTSRANREVKRERLAAAEAAERRKSAERSTRKKDRDERAE